MIEYTHFFQGCKTPPQWLSQERTSVFFKATRGCSSIYLRCKPVRSPVVSSVRASTWIIEISYRSH